MGKVTRTEGCQEGGRDRDRIPESWTGRRVKVELRTGGEGSYMVLGRLRDVTDKEIEIARESCTDSSERSPERPKSYSRIRILDVQPLEDR